MSEKDRDQFEEMKLDVSMSWIVNEMNLAETVTTFSSCGGHPNPRPGQVAEGDWYVNFYVDETEKGWADLDLLAKAASKCQGVELTGWWDGGLNFELRGTGSEPNEMFRTIHELKDA